MHKTCTGSKKKLKMYHFRPLLDKMKKIEPYGHFVSKFTLLYMFFLHVFISDGLTITQKPNNHYFHGDNIQNIPFLSNLSKYGQKWYILGFFSALVHDFCVFSPVLSQWESHIELDTPQPILLRENFRFQFLHFTRGKFFSKKGSTT